MLKVSRHTTLPLPAANDEEGAHLADDLPPLIDAHVHTFPDRIFDAVWRWFDQYGWPVRYQLYADDVIQFQRARGVKHQVLLHYAHKPGMARMMNTFVADLVQRHPDVTGMATVYPGEPDSTDLLEAAFAQGLKGVKLHCHVQGMPADDARLFDTYALCQSRGLPVVIHAGREPKSEHLPVDPYVICEVGRLEHIAKQFPRLKLVVPHLGADEFVQYARLLATHANVWLDTTMMLSSYFDLGAQQNALGDGGEHLRAAIRARADRVMFGTDFPNLPYAWDREARALPSMRLSDPELERVCAGNARDLFGIPVR
jgi:hypothetical protein